MQAKLKMRLEYEQPLSYESQSPFINVLPNEPSQAYKRFDYSRLQALKKTQKIPFPLVRELILAYLMPNQQVIDTQQSDLFKQKLSSDKYQKDHLAVNQIYDELNKEKVRLTKLYEVTHKYIERRQKLVSNELRRTINRRYDSSQLGNILRDIEEKKQNELRQLQKRVEQSAKTRINIDANKQKILIEQEQNKQILKLFEEQLPKLQKLSQEFHQMFQNVNWFKLFLQDFQKSLVFIMSARKISNKPNKRAQERLLKDSFYPQLKTTINSLTQYLHQSLQHLFEWRVQIKYGTSNLQQVQVKKRYNEWVELICLNVYNLLPDIIGILKSDRQTIKMVQSQINKQYSIFLPGYYDAKEVALFYKKQSKIQQTLQNEKQLLIDHLKKNYSMMVYYTKSADYMGSIEEYKSKNKGYLREILDKKIGLLDIAINFINKQYGQLYKQACDGKYGIKDKILSKCRSLEGSLNQNQTILSLLLQSCRRLLNIVNK